MVTRVPRKLAVQPTKKVGRLGVKPEKGRGTVLVNPKSSGGGFIPTKLAPKPVKIIKQPQPTPRIGNGVSFQLPVYGGSNPNQIDTTQLSNSGLIQWYNQQNPNNPIGSGPLTDALSNENPFTRINEFIEEISSGRVWFTAGLFILAVFIIIVSLYGIVSSGQNNIMKSVLGQNASNLANSFKPKMKRKK